MKLKTALIAVFFSLALSVFLIPTQVDAVGICGVRENNLDPKACFALDSGETCQYATEQLEAAGVTSSVRCCNELPSNTQGRSADGYNIVGIVDVNSDGTVDGADVYNPDCFVPINAPTQVKITDFGRLFTGAVSFLLLIAFILAFFYLILGGIAWLTSGGDKANIETARNKIIAAIIGLIIVAATWALFQLVGGAIGFNILGGFELPTLF